MLSGFLHTIVLTISQFLYGRALYGKSSPFLLRWTKKQHLRYCEVILIEAFYAEVKNLKYHTDNNWKLKPACKMHQT